jgi:plasmid stabilization system protein ParE
VHGDFVVDFERQVLWLERNAGMLWIEHLEADVVRAVELLSDYPGAGALVMREGRTLLRRLVLPSTPYIAWYVYEEEQPAGDIWLPRLLHSRQRSPKPEPSRWFPADEEKR